MKPHLQELVETEKLYVDITKEKDHFIVMRRGQVVGSLLPVDGVFRFMAISHYTFKLETILVITERLLELNEKHIDSSIR